MNQTGQVFSYITIIMLVAPVVPALIWAPGIYLQKSHKQRTKYTDLVSLKAL